MGSILHDKNILVTGGAGTLGKAIARRRQEEGWKGKFTVYSTDGHKHEMMRQEFQDIQYIQGDIRNYNTLYQAMVGHDVVIHAGAVKIIPDSELWSIDTVDVNVSGSLNVCAAAVQAGIEHVVGISTDKACHAANAYGATKYLMEKTFQEYSRMGMKTEFHLVRYGNVLESNGSVIQVWKRARERGEMIRITDPEMTRFWLSPSQAVDYILDGMQLPSGMIYIPKMPSLSIHDLADFTVGLNDREDDYERVKIRPGEKMHETLLTEEEGWYVMENDEAEWFALLRTTAKRRDTPMPPYTSDTARKLTREELNRLLDNGNS